MDRERVIDRYVPLLLAAVLSGLIVGQLGGMEGLLPPSSEPVPDDVPDVGCTVTGPEPEQPANTAPPNSRWLDSPDESIQAPAFWVETNSDGFRTDVEPNRSFDGYRIAVVGDSLTYGVGANRSDLFTTVLEQRLANMTDQPVQVVNMASMGWGMEEYYQIINSTVLEYEPDRVIITFEPRDEMARKEFHAWKDEFMPNVSEDLDPKARDDAVNKLIQQRLAERLDERSFAESDIRRYAARIHQILEGQDVPHSFVLVDQFNSGFNYTHILGDAELFTTSRLDRWSEYCGIPMYGLPPEFRDTEDWKEYLLLPRDWHYNPRGHRVLARHMQRILVNEGWPER